MKNKEGEKRRNEEVFDLILSNVERAVEGEWLLRTAFSGGKALILSFCSVLILKRDKINPSITQSFLFFDVGASKMSLLFYWNRYIWIDLKVLCRKTKGCQIHPLGVNKYYHPVRIACSVSIPAIIGRENM